MKKFMLPLFSLALAVNTFAMENKTNSMYWSMDGDPLIASKYTKYKFGYQKINIQYSGIDNSPGNKLQKVGTLENSWFRVPSAKEDPTLEGKYGYIPSSTTSGYATSLHTTAQKRAVAIFGTLTQGVCQEYDDWTKLKELNRTNTEIYNAIVKFQQSDTDQTVIFQDKGVDKNAFYMPQYNNTPSSLNFFHFKDKKNSTKYTGDSSDILLHEAGHKRLTDMHPDVDSSGLEFGSFHEGYGDVYSMIYSVRSNAQRSLALAQCGMHLDQPNIISDLAEEFGTSLGYKNGLRALSAHKIFGETDLEVHAVGQVWADAWYKVLVTGYQFLIGQRYNSSMNETQKLAMYDQALRDTGDYVGRLSLLSTLLVTNPSPKLFDFANKAYVLSNERKVLTGKKDVDNAPWDTAINTVFSASRGIPVKSPGSLAFNVISSTTKKGVCGGLTQYSESNNK